MTAIFGALGVNETDRVYLSTLGQRVIYDAVTALLVQYNLDLAKQIAVFVERLTTDHKLRYKLPGGGRLQRLGGQAQAGAVKSTGQWDIALPLEGFGAQVASDRISMAYMTVQDLDRHLTTVFIQGANTARFEILRALFNSSARTFVDPLWGSLTIEPLANGDSVLYPPVLGTTAEATENHYLESGYAASAISDANNPLVTINDELEEHFGATQGGSNIIAFINPAQRAKIEALTDFEPLPDRFVVPGADTATLIGLPMMVPGRIIGRSNGVWISEWRWIPANYIVGVHLDAPKPLLQRTDPAETGLGTGLQLVAEDEEHPISSSHYEYRLGFGVGNRLNGVVLELGTGGTYTTPSDYQ